MAAKAATEVIYRITYPRADGGENYAAYRDEDKAVRCLMKRLRWGAHTGAVLTACERTVNSWDGERVIKTRCFDQAGRELQVA